MMPNVFRAINALTATFVAVRRIWIRLCVRACRSAIERYGFSGLSFFPSKCRAGDSNPDLPDQESGLLPLEFARH
jgi:hypothetical protein